MQNEIVQKMILANEDLELTPIEVNALACDDELMENYLHNNHHTPYSKLIFILTHRKIQEDKAYLLWDKINTHRKSLKSILGRPVGMNVATLDYLENIVSQNNNLKIIDQSSFEALVDFSTIDELTQLYNRDVFEIFIQKLFNEAKRNQGVISYAMFDIDDFKIVNDTYGHQTGDEVLKKVGAIIKENIREMDIAVRYGGEELGVIFPNIDKKSAVLIVERIREKIEAEFKNSWNVTISCGISDSNEKMDKDSFIASADEYLYKAKRAGKNQVQYQ